MSRRSVLVLKPPALRFGIALTFLGLCLLFGGSSFGAAAGLLILQPAAVICAAAALLIPGKADWEELKWPLALLGALAALMTLQLLPLPPVLWRALPGHDQLAPFAAIGGNAGAWRPLSLTPDLTLESLAGLVVPAAMLVILVTLDDTQKRRLLLAAVVTIMASVVIGAAQMAGGPDSALYFYRFANTDSPVGFFSNRNHQAAFLATAFPALTVWALAPVSSRQQRRIRLLISVAAALFLLPIILIMGSRAGLILMVAAIGFAWWIARSYRRSGRGAPALSTPLRLAIVFGGIVVVGATYFRSRVTAADRLFGQDFGEDARARALPTLVRIAQDFFPTGTGFGSFDRIYRFYEPFEMLDRQYLNHAHNELIELIITGGLPALLLLAAFIYWVARAAWRSERSGRSAVPFSRLAVANIVIMLLASLVDYPLRTPLIAAYLALNCAWLAYASRTASPSRPQESEKALPVETSGIPRAGGARI